MTPPTPDEIAVTDERSAFEALLSALISSAYHRDLDGTAAHVEKYHAAVLAAFDAARQSEDARDAERYRWLRARRPGDNNLIVSDIDADVYRLEADLDKAIDTARKPS